MPHDYVTAVWCYMISALLDAFDGHAARHFNQSTRFGAMLDQLTDRCGTMCLLVTLSHFYPKYMFWFQLSMTIDIACHWLYLHTTTLQGIIFKCKTKWENMLQTDFSLFLGKTSHKFVDMSGNPIMRLYYTSKPVLFTMCAVNECFYASLYLLHFTEGPLILGMSLYRLIAYLTAPLAIIKSLISVLHALVASKNLSIIDVHERKNLKTN